ncbi:MAG: ATP-grasp domain-containing protein [Clostridiales bacterium]|nr:ATP-grasp domain-containing protein [Clostridiales bacterium]
MTTEKPLEQTLVPVLLGADLNCYNVARAFHEEYHVISYAFGRYALGATAHSRIVRFTAVPELNAAPVMVKTLTDFAKTQKGKILILIGCTDEYVDLIIQNKPLLQNDYILPYTTPELASRVSAKDIFCSYCQEYNLPHPKTVIIHPDSSLEQLNALPFSYPVVIKPSSSAVYWQHPFDGMHKVYIGKNKEEAEAIIKRIFASGYPLSLVVQDFVPGDDSRMYVLTAYADKNAKVKMMCLGHVLLEEHTPKGLGNHAAILTEVNRPLMEKLKAFLEGIGFVGYANFDIKYDERDGEYKVFEFNIRQGRSCYYVTASGANIARYLVEDYVNDALPEKCLFVEEPVYWRYIPDPIVYRYVNKDLAKRVKKCKKEGKAASSLRYAPDLRWNMKRYLFVQLHEHNHYKKYKKYYHP